MKIFGSFLAKIALLSFMLVAVAPVVAPVISGDAYAQGTTSTPAATDETEDNAFTRVMCRALNIVTGSAGKAFAAFAIISVGIGFFTGKVSWGLMIGVAAGIAAMFGAPTIVKAISGDDAVNCSDFASKSATDGN